MLIMGIDPGRTGGLVVLEKDGMRWKLVGAVQFVKHLPFHYEGLYYDACNRVHLSPNIRDSIDLVGLETATRRDNQLTVLTELWASIIQDCQHSLFQFPSATWHSAHLIKPVRGLNKIKTKDQARKRCQFLLTNPDDLSRNRNGIIFDWASDATCIAVYAASLAERQELIERRAV